MASCFYCKKEFQSIDSVHLIRVRAHGPRASRWRTAAYCCPDCEKSGKGCRFSQAAWDRLKAEHQ